METKNIFAMIDEIKSAWDKDHPQTVIAKFTEVSEQFIKDSDYKGLLVFFKQCLHFLKKYFRKLHANPSCQGIGSMDCAR